MEIARLLHKSERMTKYKKQKKKKKTGNFAAKKSNAIHTLYAISSKHHLRSTRRQLGKDVNAVEFGECAIWFNVPSPHTLLYSIANQLM